MIHNTQLQSATLKLKLLDQVRSALRTKHYSLRSEEFYGSWIKRFILFHKKRHPREMGEAEVNQFLTYLVVQKMWRLQRRTRRFAPFLYKHVLKIEYGEHELAMKVKSFGGKWDKKSAYGDYPLKLFRLWNWKIEWSIRTIGEKEL